MKILIHFIVFCVLLNSVLSLGLLPAYEEVVFYPEKSQDITLTILNNENKNLDLVLIPKNELAGYIEHDEEIIHIDANQPSKNIVYTLKTPKKLTPGTRRADILIMEFNNKNNGILTTSLGLVHQLRVLVPYPDQYVQGIMYTDQLTLKEQSPITLSLHNLGTKDVENIQAEIIITDPFEQTIAVLTSTATSLAAGQKGKVTALWDVDVDPGRYFLQAIVRYDDKVLLLDKEIDVGEALIEIIALKTFPFKLGNIAKLDISLKNLWNQPITDVVNDLRVIDDQAAQIFQTTSPTINLAPYDTQDVSVYWDTSGVDEGDYDISVKTSYLGRFTEKLFETKVTQNQIIVLNNDATGFVAGESDTTSIAYIIFGAIIIAALLGLVVFMKKKQPKKSIYQQKKPIESTPRIIPRHPELQGYIIKKIQEGYSIPIIRQSLMKKGWSKEIIDQEMIEIEDELT